MKIKEYNDRQRIRGTINGLEEKCRKLEANQARLIRESDVKSVQLNRAGLFLNGCISELKRMPKDLLSIQMRQMLYPAVDSKSGVMDSESGVMDSNNESGLVASNNESGLVDCQNAGGTNQDA